MTEYVVGKRSVALIMLGLMLGLLMAALDQTVVGTAIPQIAKDFHSVQEIVWPITAYLLSSTIAMLFIGKVSDVYGRKLVFVSGIVVFIVSSALCGLAQDMTQLIAFRAAQGVGAGILISIAFVIVGDIFPSRQRGKYTGLLSGMFGLASVLGPYMGGFITDNLGWRWVFYVNIPLGVLAFALVLAKLPTIKGIGSSRSLDYPGFIAATVGLVPLLLAISWGGTQYAWSSPEIMGMIIVSLIGLISFVFIEMRATSPLLPLRMFSNSIYTNTNVGAFLANLIMMTTIMATSLFAQIALGYSATMSGQILTVGVLSLTVASIMTGQLISRTGRYKLLGIAGFAITCLGVLLLTGLSLGISNADLYVCLATWGFGNGMILPVLSVAVQNACSLQDRAIATSSNFFFRNTGGTVGVAILDNITAGSLQAAAGHGGTIDPSKVVASLQTVFWVCVIVAVVGLIVMLFLREIPLKEHDTTVIIARDSVEE